MHYSSDTVGIPVSVFKMSLSLRLEHPIDRDGSDAIKVSLLGLRLLAIDPIDTWRVPLFSL